ncbi:MAG: ligase-associated DNA damage response endonuclease PdeM [Flavobacteriaceae bacterium]|nr:ligase-associated DNA damage response endonuclease PdeM [Eudoraea sp.]NNJ39086.1 ligase-associated DNA damage response endonuclease PdeM [Flavobacteriaceae bacterium]
MTLSVTIHNEPFILHPSGALFWDNPKILLISDVHLGKVSHFRKSGAAVPQAAILRNFDMLDQVLAFFNPREVYFLGDLFHSYLNKEWHLFENWIGKQSARFTLITGNHDIISPLKFELLGIRVCLELHNKPFFFTHHPAEQEGYFNFSGHLHPAVRLKGMGRQSLRLPCFFRNKTQMILPAFGEFTGSHVLSPGKKDQVYAIASNEVIDVSPTTII